MIRLAVIGMGDMGSAHARGFDLLEPGTVVAVCDTLPDWHALRPVAWQKDVPAFFADHRVMLDEVKPDAVVVAVPGWLHREVTIDALRAGCHVFLEKPLATTLEDCDAVLDEAERRNRILQVGLVYRYSRLYNEMAALVHRHGIGPVRLMWCKELRQCFPQEAWFYDQERCGGTIVEKNGHHFDLFAWMIGSRPVRVSAVGGQHVYRRGEPATIACSYSPAPPRVVHDITTVDHAAITVEFENGAVASLLLCMYLRPWNVMPEGLEIGGIGLGGRQICAYQDRRLGVSDGDAWTWVPYDAAADHHGLGHVGCQAQRRAFLDCVAQNQSPLADGAIGRQALLVSLAAERSIREGRAVDIADGRLR